MFPQQRTKAPHRNALIGMKMFNENLSDTETEEKWYLDSGCPVCARTTPKSVFTRCVYGKKDIQYKAIKNKNLFVINMKVDTRENCEESNLLAGYASGIRSIQDWHERLAHQNFQHVRSLLKSLNIEFKDDKKCLLRILFARKTMQTTIQN
ncbi:hypothetical protein ILUMI_16192 [Ignelater luminosus]|uniref:GAG-pre-integrase domain-containing protein n=1 Tax=Ignelater luminosus TaxID=2038154 RepID=A0A8K0G8S9_IGNLU|nr:hypothetical protein ILUMI_16192 [Ignelater luminosus]